MTVIVCANDYNLCNIPLFVMPTIPTKIKNWGQQLWLEVNLAAAAMLAAQCYNLMKLWQNSIILFKLTLTIFYANFTVFWLKINKTSVIADIQLSRAISGLHFLWMHLHFLLIIYKCFHWRTWFVVGGGILESCRNV